MFPRRSLLPLAIGLIATATASSARADEPAPPPPAKAEGREPPTFQLPRCADPEAEDELRTSTGCSGVFGVRGSMTAARGTGGEGAGLMVSAEGEEFLRRRIFSVHGMHRLGIGGGGAGFEGALLGGMAGGFRIPVGERHGPVIRAGVLGWLRGNDAHGASLLELPQVQLGYQYMRGTTVFEVGGTTGVVLVGRERGGDATRRLLGEGFEVGAYAAAQMPWVRLGARALQLPTSDTIDSNVRMAEGTLCAIASPMAICADARVSRMDAFTAPGTIREVTALHAGLSLGFTRER